MGLLRRGGGEFPEEQIAKASLAGSKLVQQAGGPVKAGEQIKKKPPDARYRSVEFIGNHGYLYPSTLDSVFEITTTGGPPNGKLFECDNHERGKTT